MEEKFEFKSLFKTYKTENDTYSVRYGNTKATLKEFETEEEAKQLIEKKDWDLIGTVVMRTYEHIMEINKDKQQ